MGRGMPCGAAAQQRTSTSVQLARHTRGVVSGEWRDAEFRGPGWHYSKQLWMGWTSKGKGRTANVAMAVNKNLIVLAVFSVLFR